VVALAACGVLWRGQGRLHDRAGSLERTINAQDEQLRRAASELRSVRDNTATELDAIRAELPEVPDIAQVAQEVQPSVFTIETDTGQGSGWVVASAGSRSRVITNFHVVAEVWTNGGRHVAVLKEDGTYDGTILEVDEAADLAVIEVPVALRPLARATSAPHVGDAVLALGSPLGLEGTVSSGIVSALRVEDGFEYLQFSAPISPGNSGGPVVDTEGRVVGVSVAKAVAEGAEGLSFAIPVNEVCVHLEVC
jgi:putative serine protease PepD